MIISLKKFNIIKPKDKKIVMCNGCFDILHIGHIKHFEEAKEYSDILVVTVTKDRFVKKSKGKNRPIFPLYIRMEMIDALKCVDYVIANDWETPYELLTKIKPDVYAKGNDWLIKFIKKDKNIEREVNYVKSYGGLVVFTNENKKRVSDILKELE